MTLLLDLAIRSSVILAAGLLLCAALAQRSAALRHRVLATALLAAGLVMPFTMTLPAWSVTLPSRANAAVTATPPTHAGIHVDTQAAAAPETQAPTTISPIVLLWLIGVLVVGGTLISGVVRVSRLAARASRIEDGRWLHILETVATRYGLTREVVIARTDSADMLATWGFRRPQVLVPHRVRDWTADRVHVVLCHELAHIRRHDWLVHMGAEALRAVLWFNPLVWIACTRLRRESELACDDEVLGIGVSGRDYAAHLLELARQCRRPGSSWASAMPMAHPSTLERRISAMLNPRLDRQGPSRRVMAALGVMFLFITLPVAAIRARQAGPTPLTGTVYDVTGGVMPGVEVALVDGQQNRWAATSRANGRFELPAVGPGKYVLEAGHRGFRPLREEFELRDARDWDRAVTLQVGELEETITVREHRSAGAPSQQPSLRSGTQPLRVGGNIRAPMKVKDVRPSYPESMREAGLTGVVPIEAIIGRDGSVTTVRVLSAQVHPDFAIAAVDAVRRWRFTPTLLNGVAVEVVMTVSVTFDLEG